MSQPLSLPPHVLLFLEWLKKTDGRDKLYRLIAYGSKIPIHILKQNGGDKDTIQRLTKGASAVGQTRKLMRMFRSLEYTQEFLKAFLVKDEFERYSGLLKNFLLAVWMVADHIQWLNKAGYLKLTDTKKLDEIHSKAWFYGLFFGILLSAYKLKAVVEQLTTARHSLRVAESNDSKDGKATASGKLRELEGKQFKTAQGLAKSLLDIIIPAARLEWLPVSDGVVGLAGTITSVMGIYDTWPAAKKL